ncbi:MAG: recombinase family protein [Oscillospiraceae bacterium]|nr:recombinase family protein [Oscillospiraceae bacterium]
MLKNRSIPFGYCMVNGKYALNAPEAETVRKIFDKYIGGKSLKTIAAEMQIPYNTGKAVWNKNMVCRVLENKKYIGENGYPQIVTAEDFEQAAYIKVERNTYRKPALQDKPQQVEIPITEYRPTDEIQRMTNEINRQLDTENPDKEKIEALIIMCAQLKYTTVNEVKP